MVHPPLDVAAGDEALAPLNLRHEVHLYVLFAQVHGRTRWRQHIVLAAAAALVELLLEVRIAAPFVVKIDAIAREQEGRNGCQKLKGVHAR